MRTAWESIVAPTGLARRYREQGWWRDATFSEDLRESAAEAPDETAFLTWRQREKRLIALSFREFDVRADAVAGALQRLGVGRGDVVAYQLPAWWETAVLMIACQRVGAIVAPLHTLSGSFETERVLAATGAVACVVADEYDGVGQARQLLEQAPRLPSLRHRIVIGDAAATNAVSLDDVFYGRHSTVERPSDLVPFGSDEVCALLMTSGTTGESQLVAHSLNTLYAVPRQAPAPGQLRALTSGMSFVSAFRMTLHATWRGVPTLFSDSRSPETWLDLIEEAKVTELRTSPRMLRTLVEEQRRRARDVSSLESVCSFGGVIPPVTLSDVRERLCPVVRNVWGMTECGNVLTTAAEDPPEQASRSLGRMGQDGGEVRLEPAGRAHHRGDVFRLHVRGPAVCLATVGRDSGQVRWSPDTDDGWLDTGDLVTPDGTGGLRFVGRVAERIGDAWQVPVTDVENALLTHSGVEDAVLLPWPHTDGRETPCAAVISATPLELRDLRDHLDRLGFRELCLPTRIEHVTEFPRTELGKVRRKILLDRLRERAAVTAG
ncbi:cyclohexanecarboxylate-CoA ligase [Actinoplanes lobatus]|uniref:Cyclohexanecarboxylate-CoA ligase n=1 Tax=Actinoplanes lobatus TaxID=113568 RepID=A0A7W7MH73_9ACTN|nr:AMP-binding protein [Actinoplanes lobatus]MBB4750031.1 cyclohexanecarboxylate-CoA ligase [Actinoplanes lobatus]GGN74859.1 cyclohexanecarboxylate-CoA ligase [Actinoplanes lobatus]GIE39080.1 cyclohexanecarboxylate-CoA ligase [Actinoplanes lobatus]